MLELAGIAGDSIVDGPGIRTTYFAQGCPHHCRGCHNPETWQFGTGTAWEAADLAGIAIRNPLCRGVTFSGGEPFCQAAGFCELAELLKAAGFEIAAYTGYTFEHLQNAGDADQKRLLALLDVLVDGPFILSRRSLELCYRGSDNQRAINVPKSLETGRIIPAPPRWHGEY